MSGKVYIDPNADEEEIRRLLKPGVSFSYGYPLEGSTRSTTHPPNHELKEVDFDKIFTDFETTINDLYSKTNEELEELQPDDDGPDDSSECCIVERIIENLLHAARENYCPHYPIERFHATSAFFFRIDNFMAGKKDRKKNVLLGMDIEGVVNQIFDENKLVGTMWKEKDDVDMKTSIVDMYRGRNYPNLQWDYFRDLISEVWFEDGDKDKLDLDETDPGYYPAENGEENVEAKKDKEVDKKRGGDEEQEEDEDEEDDEDYDEGEEEYDEDEDEDEDEEDEDEEEEYHEDEPARKRARH